MDATQADAKRGELTRSLRRARGWILAVGILMSVVEVVRLFVSDNDFTTAQRDRTLMLDAGGLAAFVGLWWFAQYRPKLACILALIVFWGIYIYASGGDIRTLIVDGMLMKAAFTFVLILGLKSAERAETLQKELADVFG